MVNEKRGARLASKATSYSAISLFTGAGGLDLGFERAGFNVVFANELDKDAAETWRINRSNPEVMHQGDINESLDLFKAYKGADIVFGGPPCQGFSVAGKMDPEDPRSQLIWSFLKVVDVVQPKVFVIENVRALGVLDKWKSVREGILEKADELGYKCSFRVYSASEFGVPQNRERVVFIGINKDSVAPETVFAYMDTLMHKPKPLKVVLKGVGQYGSADNPQTCTSHISLAKNPVLRQSPYAGMLVNGAGRPMDLDGVAHTLPASMGGNKTPIIDQLALENDSENWFCGYLRELISGSATPEHTTVPDYLRRLTIKEAAALQTFPSDYVFCGRKTSQYKQIGNAVAANFAHAIGQSVRACCLDV